ncbi:MAG: hypothetical protein P8R42_06770 [Candidatus Binatia bacterium]|nr:hypothetical protein [Candidatus Binatia bacterium]
MKKPLSLLACLLVVALTGLAEDASALSKDRWTNAKPYGVFFNDYDPNFYTGFVPRVQQADRIKIHLGRGNQLRVRMILPDETIDNFVVDQVTKHDLYQEVIDEGVIELTANKAWEDYDKRFRESGLREIAAKKGSVSPQEWRQLNVQALQKLQPERVYHIQKDFGQMTKDFYASLAAAPEPKNLGAKLDLVNGYFKNRIFAYNLTKEQDAALAELITLAKASDEAGFTPKAQAFFASVTDGVYPVTDGKIDYYEYTAIWAAGTYDKTKKINGQEMPWITTPGVWTFIPRMHGKGITGMVDYISSAGYYGLIPMFPYEYGGGIAYNAIHNTGISNWIQGHPLLPKEWKTYTDGSRTGKPYNRVAVTSRGPVSHGCTRLGSGHLAELREMLPSTSEAMKGIVNYRNVSQCYDVFDRAGDGNEEVMGVQYYIAFRHTNERVAKHIWAQNNREDFYNWLYGSDMKFGPIGDVTFDEVCTGKFVKKKAAVGEKYENLKLYEAPYEPETIQFYKIKGVGQLSKEGMDFNREMRRVGAGYQVDRKKLRLDSKKSAAAQ